MQQLLQYLPSIPWKVLQKKSERLSKTSPTLTSIFPHCWQYGLGLSLSQSKTNCMQDGNIDKKNPYLHDAIVLVLKNSLFSSYSSLGHELDIFDLCHDDCPESELTPPLLALVSTAVFVQLSIVISLLLNLIAFQIYSAIDEYSSGVHENRKFNTSVIEDVYGSHIAVLNELQTNYPNQARRILSELHAKVKYVLSCSYDCNS